MDESKARKILGEWVRHNDALGANAPEYVDYIPGSKSGRAILDGAFDVEELEAIAWWVRNKP